MKPTIANVVLDIVALCPSNSAFYELSTIPMKLFVPLCGSTRYCVKCRASREMKDTEAITMKNGRPATQGVCPECGTKMFRIGKAS